MMKWILIGIFIFSAAVGGGLYFFKGGGSGGTATELDWRALGEMDYLANKPSDVLSKASGTRVKIPGFMVPLEDNQRLVTGTKRVCFLLRAGGLQIPVRPTGLCLATSLCLDCKICSRSKPTLIRPR